MSDISGSSTLDELLAAHGDNASYEEDGSTAKAKAFITACRALIVRLPNMAGHSGNQMQFSVPMLQQQISEARQWLASRSSTSSDGTRHTPVRYASFSNFR